MADRVIDVCGDADDEQKEQSADEKEKPMRRRDLPLSHPLVLAALEEEYIAWQEERDQLLYLELIRNIFFRPPQNGFVHRNRNFNMTGEADSGNETNNESSSESEDEEGDEEEESDEEYVEIEDSFSEWSEDEGAGSSGSDLEPYTEDEF